MTQSLEAHAIANAHTEIPTSNAWRQIWSYIVVMISNSRADLSSCATQVGNISLTWHRLAGTSLIQSLTAGDNSTAATCLTAVPPPVSNAAGVAVNMLASAPTAAAASLSSGSSWMQRTLRCGEPTALHCDQIIQCCVQVRRAYSARHRSVHRAGCRC